MTDSAPSGTTPKPLILVVDDQAIIREPIAARLASEGYRTIHADNGRDAVSIIQQQHPDLVLLDIAIPKMNGIEVLKFIRSQPPIASTPVILLTAMADRRVLGVAVQLGVRDYLLKSNFSLSDMLARVARYFPDPAPVVAKASAATDEISRAGAAATPKSAAAEVLPPMQRDQCLGRVEKVLEGRALSGIVTEVLMLVNSPRSALADLAPVIGRDPALTARILTTANSTAFRGARKMVTTLPDAVKQLGCGNIRNIAMTLGIIEVMPTPQADGFNPIRSWQHSFAVALLSEHLCADSPDEKDSSVAYLIGLCHDLGEILFRTEFGGEYAQILEAHQQNSRPMHELEQEMLGITQGELAAIILKKLGLPENIRYPIDQFHASPNRMTHPPTDRLARVLHLADLFANGIMMAAASGAAIAPVGKAMFRDLFGKNDPALPDVESVRSQILALTSMMANLPAADQAKLMQPLLKPTRKRALYVRDPLFSAFDPMAAALNLLATVTTQAKLPDRIDPSAHDAIILARPQGPEMDMKIPVLHINPDPATKPASSGSVTTVTSISLEKLSNFLLSSTPAAKAAA
jgi:HD-like signal output (HDOD) protein/CheY-like chemotaxis protein